MTPCSGHSCPVSATLSGARRLRHTPSAAARSGARWSPCTPTHHLVSCVATSRGDTCVQGTHTLDPWGRRAGPVYKLPSSFGQAPTAVVLRKETTPKPKRFHPPAFIKARSSMGRQALSRSRSNPSFGFSKSKRQTILK